MEEQVMVAVKTRRRATSDCASMLPDDRVVVATALLALSTLVLMLCAGIA
jgi:hypothetical protein